MEANLGNTAINSNNPKYIFLFSYLFWGIRGWTPSASCILGEHFTTEFFYTPAPYSSLYKINIKYLPWIWISYTGWVTLTEIGETKSVSDFWDFWCCFGVFL